MTDREREQWVKVAEALGLRAEEDHLNLSIHSNETNAVYLLHGCDATKHHVAETVAMLHGLACLECNGGVWKEEGQWFGQLCCPETGDTLWCSADGYGTLPKILLAMLEAHREGE